MTPFGREREGPVFFNQKSRHTHSLSVKHTRQVSSTLLLLFTSYRDSWEERKEREKSGENNCKKRVSVCRNKRGKERKRLFSTTFDVFFAPGYALSLSFIFSTFYANHFYHNKGMKPVIKYHHHHFAE